MKNKNLILAKKALNEEIKAIDDYSKFIKESDDKVLKEIFKHNLKEEREHAKYLAKYIKKQHNVKINESVLFAELYKDPLTKIYSILNGIITNVSTTPAKKLPIYSKFIEIMQAIKNNIKEYNVVQTLTNDAKSIISKVIYLSNTAKEVIYKDLDNVLEIVKEDLQ